MILIKNSSSIDYDELIDKAVKACSSYDAVSASFIQRRLSVGYARAARIIDQLEFAGIVGKSDNSPVRKVLIHKTNKVNKSNFSKEGTKEFLMASAKMIKYTLEAHGIIARINSVSTTEKSISFFFEIPVGSSIDKVLNLKKELAMALASPTGKIEMDAPFKGTSMIALFLPAKNKLKKQSFRVISQEFELPSLPNNPSAKVKTGLKEFLLRLSRLLEYAAYRI